MRKIITAAGASFAVALMAVAASLSYSTLSDAGTAASPAEVIFPSVEMKNIRLVGVNWSSDTNNASMSFSYGTSAKVITVANASSSGVTQVLDSVTGLAANDVLVLQQSGVCYAATLSSTNNGTNAVLASGGWGVASVAGSEVFKMSTATTIPIGATTNAQNGEAIFVSSQQSRPVRVVLSPANVTNRINTATAIYE